MLNFHMEQDLTILESIPFCDDRHDNYNVNSVDAIIACLRSVNFWAFDGIHLSGIRKYFKILSVRENFEFKYFERKVSLLKIWSKFKVC